MQTWVKRLETFLVVFLLLLMTFCMASCSELRLEFDPNKWRYQPYRDMPPSWESDMGRPGPEYSGEDMFGDTW